MIETKKYQPRNLTDVIKIKLDISLDSSQDINNAS